MDGPLSVASLLHSHDNRKVSFYRLLSSPHGIMFATHFGHHRHNPVDAHLLTAVQCQRSHDQMSSESRTATCTSSRLSTASGHNTSSSSSSTVFGNLRIPSFRLHPRDGFDMRTPLMSQHHQRPQPPPPPRPQQDVIDLTQESSSPRAGFVLPPERTPDPLLRRPSRTSPTRSLRNRQNNPPDHNVIDLSEDDNNRQSSPDIQFLSSRARSRSVSIGDRQSTLRPPPQSDVREPANSTSWPQPRLPLPFNFGGFTRFRNHLAAWRGFPVEDQDNFDLPNVLDFQSVGFDLDYPQRQPPAEPRLPTYEAPPEPREGFTRSSKADDDTDVMVCVNCEDELGVGQNDVKRQVWFVRACGHVCATESAMMDNNN